MLAVLLALDVARGVVIRSLQMPGSVSGAIFDAAIAFLVPLVSAMAVIGGVVCVIGIVCLPAKGPRAIRRGTTTVLDGIRDRGRSSGVISPKFSGALYHYRKVGWTLIVAGASAVLLFVRPLTPGLVIGTVVVALLVAFVFACLQRAPAPTPAEGAALAV